MRPSLPRLPDLGAPQGIAAHRATVARSLATYGPAAEGDLLSWSGLPRAEISLALAALRHEITPVRVHGLSPEQMALLCDVEQLRATRSAKSLPWR
ncbi:DNA glycosylase AlkZ-like family protein [Streptomyces sp. NPDC058301]|uniref:DNA glycosylase AlkZ-like family protein n=1 Tax=Streptomyces sp. NPDC058301 TaxID=3346436 RepID=UPI0036E0BE88